MAKTTTKQGKADWFDRFYQAYPRKVSVGAARKAWEKIDPDDDLALKIILAVDAQKRWRKREKENNTFVPEWKHPATWLNQKCWLDEIPSASQEQERKTEVRHCQKCDRTAVVYVGNDGYCARHYRDLFINDRGMIYDTCKRIGMQKKADETHAEYYERCKQWCLSQGYKARAEAERV